MSKINKKKPRSRNNWRDINTDAGLILKKYQKLTGVLPKQEALEVAQRVQAIGIDMPPLVVELLNFVILGRTKYMRQLGLSISFKNLDLYHMAIHHEVQAIAEKAKKFRLAKHEYHWNGKFEISLNNLVRFAFEKAAHFTSDELRGSAELKAVTKWRTMPEYQALVAERYYAYASAIEDFSEDMPMKPKPIATKVRRSR